MNILFADDFEDIRMLFQMALRRHGIHARTVENGRQAVEAMQDDSIAFDAIVLDIDMPIMNGWQALAAIRQLPQGRSIPVVMFTGTHFQETMDWVQRAGANRLLFKPLLPQDLAAVLHDVAPAQ